MKNSIAFITSFIATVSVFSPVAVAEHIVMPKTAAAAAHCGDDKKDTPALSAAITASAPQVRKSRKGQ